MLIEFRYENQRSLRDKQILTNDAGRNSTTGLWKLTESIKEKS